MDTLNATTAAHSKTQPVWQGDSPLAWIELAEQSGASRAAALAMFDSLPAVTLDAMNGHWRGAGLSTGHPLDGMLEAFGWWGKAFDDPEHVDPLLFRHGGGGVVAIDPHYMPLDLAMKLQLKRQSWAIAAFRASRRLLSTSKPAARLRDVTYRGVTTAAMVYDRQPIVDLFRAVTPDMVVGLMDLRGAAPFFFTLRRAPPPRRG